MKHLLPKFLLLLCCCLFGAQLQAQDTDGDGVMDAADNCITIYNPNQTDTNADGVGDVCATCFYTNPLTDLPFLATIVQEQDCCFNGFIRQYIYKGVSFFATGQHYIDDPTIFCPSDVPVSFYNCEGTLVCTSGGLIPPTEPFTCQSTLPSDFFTVATSQELWNCETPQPCYDPSVIEPDSACIALYDPVCGCDGNTYSNSCVAYFQNGITAWEPGECNSSTYNICAGSSVQLGSDFTVPNVVYNWSPADNLSCTNCPNPIANPLVTTTYTLEEITTVNLGSDPYTTTHTVVVDYSCPVPAETLNFTMCVGDATFTTDFGVGDEEGYSVLIQPSNGSANISFVPFDWNRLTYTPNAGFVGTDQIYLSHTDWNGFGTTSELVLVNITVEDCCICPTVIDPVCGVNGVTYENACFAACDNVEVAYAGACNDCSLPPDVGPCDGIFPRWYYDSSFGTCVEFTWGGCGGNANNYETFGLCIESCGLQNCLCSNEYNPVCGSDGNTYNNACHAECQGITNYNVGACDQCNFLPEVGPCNAAFPRWYYNPTQDDCYQFVWGGCGGNSNNYLSYDLCVESCREDCICTTEYDPVCGSDGVTYSNACFAACEGVSYTAGECNDDCYDPSVIYNNIDCNSYGYDPVCGCNGVTYNNICEAFYLNGIVDYTVGSCPGSNNCDINAAWVQNLLSSACNNACASSIQLISHEGSQYIAIMEYNQFCSDGLLTVYDCTGEVHCLTGGIAGINQCPGLVNSYTYVQTLWEPSDCEACICTSEYDPVCGSDGVTYSNSCLAECEGLSWTPGVCQDGCFNPDHYLPGTDCSSYGYAPVCGCDGVTYANNCDAYYNAGLDVYYAGPCDNNCICPDVYDPVCGSDGNTYGNSCEAECAGVTWTAGACDQQGGCYDPSVLYNIDCSTYAYDPVCGCNDVTYDNICEAFYINGITSYTVGACTGGKNNVREHYLTATTPPIVICDDAKDVSMGKRLGSSTSYSNGTLRFFDNCVQYIPNPDFNGVDNIELKWCDSQGLCEVQQHKIHVGNGTNSSSTTIEQVQSLEVRYDTQNAKQVWIFDSAFDANTSDYKIYNIAGKVIATGNAETALWRLDISDWLNGVYVIQTINGTSKFLIP